MRRVSGSRNRITLQPMPLPVAHCPVIWLGARSFGREAGKLAERPASWLGGRSSGREAGKLAERK